MMKIQSTEKKMEQALSLRDMPDKAPGVSGMVARRVEGSGGAPARVIAISSGKGGVGKTNSTVNLAMAFAGMRKRVLLLDADLGLGNIDVLLGLAPKYNIGHILRGEKTVHEVVVNGPAGILILPASSGVHELTSLSPEERLALSSHLESISSGIDIMIIDTGAGISSNVLFFNVAAEEIVVVVTPEPTSITDAYALMKVLFKKHGERSFRLIVNTARSRKEGLDVYKKLSLAAERFLNVSVDYLGCVLYDENVTKSVQRQRPVMELYPGSKASICYEEIAKELLALPLRTTPKGGMQLFWRQMLGGRP
jgi:flagellar biosynthesis protein FlhG